MQKHHWLWLIGASLMLGLPLHFPLVGLGLIAWGIVEYMYTHE